MFSLGNRGREVVLDKGKERGNRKGGKRRKIGGRREVRSALPPPPATYNYGRTYI